MIHTIEFPNGMISDVYEIETTEEATYISHFLRAEDGLEEIASRACLMIMPEAIEQVMDGLRRAAGGRA